jgi:hypothetical protein
MEEKPKNMFIPIADTTKSIGCAQKNPYTSVDAIIIIPEERFLLKPSCHPSFQTPEQRKHRISSPRNLSDLSQGTTNPLSAAFVFIDEVSK